MIKRYILFLLAISAIVSFAQALTGSISGTVIDSRTKEPLIGVNVLVLDTSFGMTSDMEGRYTITRLPVGTYRWRFDYFRAIKHPLDAIPVDTASIVSSPEHILEFHGDLPAGRKRLKESLGFSFCVRLKHDMHIISEIHMKSH